MHLVRLPGSGYRWVPVDEVVTAPEALSEGLCNEVALQNFFLCSNIMGLWLLQQARVVWGRDGVSYSYPDLVRLAEQAPEGGPLIHPTAPRFLAPADMVKALRGYCRETGQQAPEGPAGITRCILESLALCYRQGLDRLSEILGRRFHVLHIVGGGSLNTLLCQLTADATGVPVLAGPVEATVAGNVLVQAQARGCVDSPQDIRDVVRESFALVEYEPHDEARWEDRYGQYMSIAARGEN